MAMIFPTLDIPTIWSNDPTIFGEFNFPDAISSEEDKQKLIDGILMETEDLEALYVSPTTLKNRIGVWSNVRKPIWDRYAITQGYIGSYNPTENVFEDSTTTRENNIIASDSNTETRNLTNTDTETRDLANGSTETRDLTNSNQETRNLSNSSTETRDLENGSTETRNLTGSSNITYNVTDKSDENRNLTEDTTNTYGSNNKTSNANISATAGYKNGADAATVAISSGSGGGSGTASVTLPINSATTLEQTDSKGGSDSVSITQGGTRTVENKKTGTENTATSDNGTVQVSGSDKGTIGITGSDTGTIGVTGSNTGTIGVQGTETGNINKNGTQTGTVGNVSDSSKDELESITVHRHGNIGVSTSASILTEEFELIGKFELYKAIIKDFKEKFCLAVY